MNKLTVKIYLDEENKHELSGDYNPSDTVAISDCIADIISQAERFKEDLKQLNDQLIKFGREEIKIRRVKFIFKRQDDTIIDNIEVNDVNDGLEKLDFVNNFFII